MKEDGPLAARRRPDPSETVGRLAVGLCRSRARLSRGDGDGDAARGGGGGRGEYRAGARCGVGARRGRAAAAGGGVQRDTVEFALPPSLAALEVGDVIALAGEAEGPFEVTEIRDGFARKVSARAVPPVLKAAVFSDRPARAAAGPAPLAEPALIAAHLPPDPATPERSRLLLAAYASPWPGEVDDAAGGDRSADCAAGAAGGDRRAGDAARPRADPCAGSAQRRDRAVGRAPGAGGFRGGSGRERTGSRSRPMRASGRCSALPGPNWCRRGATG